MILLLASSGDKVCGRNSILLGGSGWISDVHFVTRSVRVHSKGREVLAGVVCEFTAGKGLELCRVVRQDVQSLLCGSVVRADWNLAGGRRELVAWNSAESLGRIRRANDAIIGVWLNVWNHSGRPLESVSVCSNERSVCGYINAIVKLVSVCADWEGAKIVPVRVLGGSDERVSQVGSSLEENVLEICKAVHRKVAAVSSVAVEGVCVSERRIGEFDEHSHRSQSLSGSWIKSGDDVDLNLICSQDVERNRISVAEGLISERIDSLVSISPHDAVV